MSLKNIHLHFPVTSWIKRYKLFAITAFYFIAMTPALSESRQLQEANQLGQHFLLQKIMKNEYYLDCKNNGKITCPLSQSGKLLSAYYAVDALDEKDKEKIRDNISSLILAERKRGKWLWGYSTHNIVDADDTGFALQLAHQFGLKTKVADLFLFYDRSINAYATFLGRHNTDLATIRSTKNNLGIHAEVNANVYNLFTDLKYKKLINFQLVQTFQSARGYWQSYFYPGKYYSTYLNLKLLCASQQLPSNVAKGIKFIQTSQNKDGSWGTPGNPYDTALALNALFSCGNFSTTNVKQGIHYLLSTQHKTGYWMNSNPIWIYIYQDEPYTLWSAYDSQHVITTALAVKALKSYQIFSNKKI